MEKKQTLLMLQTAAEQLIREIGCQQMTMQKLMDVTGLSKGGIYHYVKSKDALLGTLLLQHAARLDAVFREAVQDEPLGSLEKPARVIMANLFDEIQDPQSVLRRIFIYLLGHQETPAVRQILEQFYHSMTEICEAWIQSGHAGAVIDARLSVPVTARHLVAYMLGLLIQESIVTPVHSSAEEAAEHVIHILRPQAGEIG